MRRNGMLRSSLRFALLASVLCVIAACGQKGDLVKPGAQSAVSSASEVVH